MSLQISKQSLEKAILQDRIKSFYELLNERQWQECFNLIDPKLKEEGRITLDDYIGSLTSFFAKSGPLENIAIGDVKLYPNERDNKYDDRDFAYAESVWIDRQKHSHKIQERWVKAANGHWYTRMVGLV